MTELSAAWAAHGDLDSASPADVRRIAEEVRVPWRRGGPEMVAITEHAVPTAGGSVRVRCYDPGPPGTKAALIYLHGGGWTFFSLDTHDRLMREYAGRAGVMVVGVDYSLSPEAKYPVALDEIVAVAEFLNDHGPEWGIDAERVAIGGDSAGANLALAASLRLRDEGHPLSLRGMVLNYGVFQRTSSAEAQKRFGGPGNMLTSDEMDGLWRNYLRDERDAEDALVCPMLADLRGLPPAFLVVPECDLLTEQSLSLAERIRSDGGAVTLELYRGAVHSFLEAVSISSLADRAFADTAAWLRAILSTDLRE